MASMRTFLATPAGAGLSLVMAAAMIGVATYEIVQYMHPGPTLPATAPMFICTETGQTFRHELKVGESLPVYSPYSQKNTGVPAVACYWNPDGTIKTDPTWVLLNDYIPGKSGVPTFCPYCGRLVVPRNPDPAPGTKPPPTLEEYYQEHPDAPRN
jgi:hypothetical protein